MSSDRCAAGTSPALPVVAAGRNRVVLVLGDHLNGRPELKKGLHARGYRVIDTDNGLEATQRALYAHPDLLLVDMDVPLLYEIVAARQILKNARLGLLPVVIFTEDEEFDSSSDELGSRPNEYITHWLDFKTLKPLLDYLLPSRQIAAF